MRKKENKFKTTLYIESQNKANLNFYSTRWDMNQNEIINHSLMHYFNDKEVNKNLVEKTIRKERRFQKGIADDRLKESLSACFFYKNAIRKILQAISDAPNKDIVYEIIDNYIKVLKLFPYPNEYANQRLLLVKSELKKAENWKPIKNQIKIALESAIDETQGKFRKGNLHSKFNI